MTLKAEQLTAVASFCLLDRRRKMEGIIESD